MLENIFTKNLVYIVIFLLLCFCSVFFAGQIFFCTSNKDIWQQTWQINIDFDINGLLFLFLYFREVPSIQKKQKHLLIQIFDSPYTSNRIYLLRNCFSSYFHAKDMYINMKGIGKILFVLNENSC